ncbi:unnamed protein product [Spirodela intermedia]|uniref:Uncharacterized protein n=2 Tax=Spirodela intermedia TaxID=51605 RepID=A0A7I8K822_SPIIN|nr:unnamed protein product [Spirodela intermedia]CAA6656936.1 unnamed protein product [Spirodela intermedia]CAA7392908.1 unnamed protein product [Spirodela intermedia]
MESDFSNKNKVIILLDSLLDLYDHLVMILSYDSTTHVLEDVIDSLIEYYHQKKNSNEARGIDLYMKGERGHERQKEKE